MSTPYGWTGKIAGINLAEKKVSILSTGDYSEDFLGGLGIGQKIYWDDGSPENHAFHEDNPLIFMTGPLTGTIAPSASRMVVCAKSPCIFPETFVSANIGGFFPTELKKAGYDGIVLFGRASEPVYLFINDNDIQIKEAGHLWGQTNSSAQAALRRETSEKARILSIGPGAENQTRIGTMLTDLAGSASMGFGSVMGAKKVKALVALGRNKIPAADPETVRAIGRAHRRMRGGDFFNLFGTPYSRPDLDQSRKKHCHGCPQGCWRSWQRLSSGAENIHKCQTSLFYSYWDRKLHGNLTEASFLASKIANDYSICVLDLAFLLLWIERCAEAGILSAKEVELPLEDMGSLAFLEAIVKKISYQEGFGRILSQGAIRASEELGEKSWEITSNFFSQTGRGIAYGPKVFIPSAVIYATEPRPSITELHEICEPLTKWGIWYHSKGDKSYLSTDVLRGIGEKFWGGRQAVDFSTYEGKAQAAALIQNRQFVKESLILCDFAWPVYDSADSEDHVGDPSMESRLLSAVVGREIDEAALNRMGERIFTLNRAILLREGRRGREDDRLPEFFFIERDEFIADVFGIHNPDLFLPGEGDEVISRKGKAVDRDEFEKMMDEYYQLRGWDPATGFIKEETLKILGIEDIS